MWWALQLCPNHKQGERSAEAATRVCHPTPPPSPALFFLQTSHPHTRRPPPAGAQHHPAALAAQVPQHRVRAIWSPAALGLGGRRGASTSRGAVEGGEPAPHAEVWAPPRRVAVPPGLADGRWDPRRPRSGLAPAWSGVPRLRHSAPQTRTQPGQAWSPLPITGNFLQSFPGRECVRSDLRAAQGSHTRQ